MSLFRRILVANRGEIACRVMRTARRLGVESVAVYSEADRHALHVEMADQAYPIGPPPAAQSYLVDEKLIEAAQRAGAEAVHPGYGFLSENAEFAEGCARAGLVFIGPPPEAIRAMGSKAGAKALMEEAGVPLIPGYHGADQDDATLRDAAAAIGYPVLLKASAGGGGKGMRVVRSAQDFAGALQGARRESQAAFDDQRMIIEKYLLDPRHIEIQVFADRHGNCVHLFERDCSVQRRHQKVLEEAPAPGLPAATRAAMGAAAVSAASAIGYVGAGTVEFIFDRDGSFYFMEMNTRLQVEHPVTEFISGQDLVEWQLRVAAGEPLPRAQDELRAVGHAIEARIYAEDALRDFLPATGRLQRLRFPPAEQNVRIDSGVREGDEVSVHYDPMIAKLICWDVDRAAALRRMHAALQATEIAGLTSNVEFLARVVSHPEFAAGRLDTGFIARHAEVLLARPQPPDDRVIALATLAVLCHQVASAERHAAASGEPNSPWHMANGWRLNEENHCRVYLVARGAPLEVVAHFDEAGFVLELPGGRLAASGRIVDGVLLASLDGVRLRAGVSLGERAVHVHHGGQAWTFEIHDPAALAAEEEAVAGALTAPMPGKLIQVSVRAGDRVARGASLVVLEAMKMEHTISAPHDGVVRSVRYAVGDLVEEGAELLVVAAEPARGPG